MSCVAPETGGLKAREEAVEILVFFCPEGASGWEEGRKEAAATAQEVRFKYVGKDDARAVDQTKNWTNMTS